VRVLRLSHRTSREFVRLNMLRVEKKKDVRVGMQEKGRLRTFQRRFCEAKARIRLEIADCDWRSFFDQSE